MPSSVKIDVDANAQDAKREFDKLAENVENLDRTFGTVFGQIGMKMRGFAADFALQVGGTFVRDVVDRWMELDQIQNTIDRNFGPDTLSDLRKWADESANIFGEGEDKILGRLGRVAEKLDLDGQDPANTAMLQGIGELAGVIQLYSPDIDDLNEAFEAVTNYLATGEGGPLEDALGDLSEETGTLAGRFDLLMEKMDPAFQALDDGAFQNQEKINELKAAYDELLTKMAEILIEAEPVFTAVADFVLIVVGAVGEAVAAFQTMWEWIGKIGDAAIATANLIPGVDIASGHVGRGASDLTGELFNSPAARDPGPGTAFRPRNPGGSVPTNAIRGGSLTINQTVQPGADAAAAGRQIVDAIEAYERTNGATWRGG